MAISRTELDCGKKLQGDIEKAILQNIDIWESELPPTTIAVLAIHALRGVWVHTLDALMETTPKEQRMEFIKAALLALKIDLATLEKRHGKAKSN